MNLFRSPKPLFSALVVQAWMLALAVPASGADILAEDFATLTDTGLPAGWTSSKTSDMDYPSEPYAGVAPPAFKFSANGNTLTTPTFATGAANLQFWAYGNGGAGSTLAVEGLVGASWTALDTVTIAQNDGTYNVTVPAAATQIRFTFTKVVNCALDDVVVQGAGEDPNLSAPASLAFGAIAPGTASTQTLALANSGTSNVLHLTALSPASGDTAKFSVGSIPASLAPGVSTNIRVVYAPGAVTNVSHSATFNLITDDPSTPTNPIVFSGSTVGGSLTISNVQYSVDGPSPLAGNRVTVSGIATYADPSGYALADASGGPWSGVYVSDLNHRPNPGDRIQLNALVQESGALTQLSAVSNYLVLATNQTVPLTAIRGNQLATEAYEGVLVRITNVVVRNTNWNNGRVYWQAGDSSGNFLVGTRAPYRYVWSSNATLTAIQGLAFTNFISPRFDADFEGRPVFEYALRGMVMTPDGPRTNWTVHVRDDVILAVTNVAIPGITNVDTGGIIYPGLFDVHNHPAYNSFPTLMFNDFPFGHRDEWGTCYEYTNEWKSCRNALRSAISDSTADVVTKYGECLELMAGCVAIQGQSNSDAEHTHPDVILFNVEQFPARTWNDIFPWESTTSDRTNLLAQIAGGAVNATIIHLCEGTDTVARAQFATWKGWGMLNSTVAIIHGAALQAADFADMSAAGAKLVW